MSKMKQNATFKAEEFERRISDLSERCKLDSWTQFTDDAECPEWLLPAIMSGRPELIRVCASSLPEDLAVRKEHVRALVDMIGVLLATNMALREHAEQTAQLVEQWAQGFKQFATLGRRIERFANFDRQEVEDDGP